MQPTSPESSQEHLFRLEPVVLLSSAHFLHDTFTAFLAPLLPLFIEKLSISLTLAGTLSAFTQLPSLLNPLIGYIDDRFNIRTLMLFAPAITATLISAMGLAPSYESLAILLLITGFSSAIFHATAPVLMTRISGKRTGMGMSFFMAGGELGRTLGPLIAVWMVSLLTIKKILPISIVGWIISGFLFFQFLSIKIPRSQLASLRTILPGSSRFFITIALVMGSRSFLITCLGLYLPTLLESQGSSLWLAGGALALYQASGVAGALLSGTFSDRLGRLPVLYTTILASSAFLTIFMHIQGGWIIPILVILGFLNLASQPVLLALVQDTFPDFRAVANGLTMAISFLSLSFASIAIGWMGDHLGLRGAFLWSAAINLIACIGLGFLTIMKVQAKTAAGK